MRQRLALIRYRNIRVSVLIRFAALAALSISFLFAQSDATPSVASAPLPEPAANTMQPDQNDSMVIRARQVLEQVTRLVASGALPAIRLRKAQEDLQDALD